MFLQTVTMLPTQGKDFTKAENFGVGIFPQNKFKKKNNNFKEIPLETPSFVSLKDDVSCIWT